MKFFNALLYVAWLTLPLAAQSPPNDLIPIQVDVVYLASDLLEGRQTGQRGELMAADYIAWRFQQIGLKPAGTDGRWFQDFPFRYHPNPHAAEGGIEGFGKNVIGLLDNQAPTTVIIGAHYDHLGLGMEGSSLHAGAPAVHNGADDNASGVACMLYLAEKLKRSNLRNNNYLFIAFSGEEMGLFGSKYFADHPTIDLTTVNYMINMDMVGRLNEEKVLAINGVGTSPTWQQILPTIQVAGIKIKTTESGIGPSDHTSFYLKNIPALHFFTGQHHDYHKPSDDSELVNYQGIKEIGDFILAIIERLDGQGKLTFTKTKDEQQQAASFKVTLGVMPDYVFDGQGMRIDAVLEGKPAEKAGLQAGDVIIQLGDKEVKNIYDYMEGLSKYSKGDKAKVKVKRKDKELEFEVIF